MKTENIKELRKEFPYLTAERIKSIIAGSKKKSYRGIKNEISRANSEYEAIATEPRLKEIEINIEWNKSRTWGYCPRATAYYTTFTGKYGKVSAYATGCGYDKASQVVADCLNQIGRGMIWARRKTRKPIPYGINISKDYIPSFKGGVGMSRYYDIAKFLGGKMEHTADAPTFDKFVFTFKAK